MSALARPSTRDLLLLALAVTAVSTSAPIIAATAAPTLAIAFWRNALGSAAIAPVAAARAGSRREVGSALRGGERAAWAAAALLALHFGTWIPSLALTSVASAVAMVAIQPVWSALIARSLHGEQLPRRAWLGMAIAIVGVVIITGVDVTVSGRAVAGDGLALVGGFFAAAYVSAGSVARQRMGTTGYTLVCYSGCAVLLLITCLVGGVRLHGFSGDDWWRIAGLTAGAQLLGHSVFNVVLRTSSATIVSLAILFEVPGAVLIAWIFLGQTPRVAALPGLLVLLVGVAVTIRSETDHRRRRVPELGAE